MHLFLLAKESTSSLLVSGDRLRRDFAAQLETKDIRASSVQLQDGPSQPNDPLVFPVLLAAWTSVLLSLKFESIRRCFMGVESRLNPWNSD